MFYFWLIIIIFGLISEIIKPMYLFGACFSLAGIIPFFMSISSIDSIGYKVVQILLFIIIVLLLIFLLRKRAIEWIKQYANRHSNLERENEAREIIDVENDRKDATSVNSVQSKKEGEKIIKSKSSLENADDENSDE